MNLKQFKYVLVLSDQGSFSKAAEELNISQPSLSQYVRKIETELGVTLFDRTGSRVRLTDAGKAYIDAGRRILDIEHRMMAQFSDIADCKTGTLVIGVSPHRSVCIIPPAVKAFREKYPGIRVIIDERVGQELIERAEHGEYDICITTLPVNEGQFIYEPMKREECVLAVPKGSPLDKRLEGKAVKRKNRTFPAVDVKKINGEDFIVLSENQLMQRILEDICRDNNIALNRIVICRSLEAELALVKEGVGPALLSSGLLREGDKKLNVYSLIQEIPMREIVVMWQKDYHPSKAVREFIEILKKT
mgnify:CR=1 FL=1